MHRTATDEIAAALLSGRTITPGARNNPSANTDGFEIVDARTQRVLNWGPWLPVFLPKGIALPRPGRQFYTEHSDLYVVETDTDGRLLATSIVHIGHLWWLSLGVVIAFAGTSLAARALSRRFLRSYFAMMGLEVPTLTDALKCGEGQAVEFKRGFAVDEARDSNHTNQVLRSIAAFANTNNGVIFIGVDDGGRVTGLDLSPKERDRLEQKIRQLVRGHIKPAPPIQVIFEDLRGTSVAKIVVSREEATAYLLGGVIYVRDGSTDVQAQPEDLKRLIREYST
jgi:hypothetical protein